jgi:hypothetical protein
VAKHQKMTKTSLLEKIKEYYNGFCFDADTFVYNPFSMLLFFEKKEFNNFWYNSGSPDQIVNFLKDQNIEFIDLVKISIPKDNVMNPSSNRFEDPPVYLFQLGYLSLRKSEDVYSLIMDYPNLEVTQSMARRILNSIFKNPTLVGNILVSLRDAFIKRKPVEFVKELNKFLSNIPYSDYTKKPHNEFYYRDLLLAFIHAANILIHTETQKSSGRPDMVLHLIDQTWVIELKVRHPGDSTDETLAKQAMLQILEQNYDSPFTNPTLLAAVIIDEKRQITSWLSNVDNSMEPDKESK